MQIVKPNVEIIDGDNLSRIFRAGTTCYRSEATTRKTPAEFAQMLIRRGHEAMLEHSMVAILIPCFESAYAERCIGAIRFAALAYQEALHRPTFIYDQECRCGDSEYLLFFGNVRAWRTLFRFYNGLYQRKSPAADLPIEIRGDVLFEDLLFQDRAGIALDLSLYRIYGDVDLGEPSVILFPRIITARFTCSEGVSLEMFRHRIMAADYEPTDIMPPTCMSPAQESTRYVNYKGQMAFAEPHWWNDEDDPLLEEKRREFELDCRQCELNYCRRLDLGMKPQDARGALTKDIRTEIVLTATVRDWADWYMLRSAPAAHPDMRRLARLFRGKAGDEFETAIQSME